jgi:hypothetical protein
MRDVYGICKCDFGDRRAVLMNAENIGKQIDLTVKDGWYVISIDGLMIARVPSRDAVEKAVAKCRNKEI